MGRIWTIARREVKVLFDQPTAYILLVVFTGLNGFLFFREADLYGAASLRPMLDLLPWLLLFLVPAVTLRALAEDSRSAELGVVVAQYVGAVLLVAGLAAVGVWASSISRNQVSAFIVAVFVMFVLILVGLDPLIVGLPARLGSIAASLGVLSHFTQIARGVIDLRDAVYFMTLAALFLMLADLALVSRKLTARGEALKRLRLGTLLVAVALVVVNLFGRNIGGRLDLTPGGAFTLAAETRRILRTLPDLVTVKLFVSSALPKEVDFTKR